jgi:hypothetical protein
MNQRYQGDGPGGQTRKSAARAKPATSAASSVHVQKKPQTDAEKRAARKRREKEAEQKAVERRRKAQEKEAALVEAAAAAGTEGDATPAKAKEPVKQPSFLSKLFAPNPAMPQSEEYKKWRKIYWILIGVGIVAIALSMVAQYTYTTFSSLWMVTLGFAYVAIIAAFFIDFRKVKPLVKAHQSMGSGNKSPKQLKHEQEARDRAAAAEAARKAAKAAKKAPRRKKDDTIVPGDE